MDENIKVLLVDDQPLLRMGFRLILEGEADIQIAGEAADGLVRRVDEEPAALGARVFREEGLHIRFVFVA